MWCGGTAATTGGDAEGNGGQSATEDWIPRWLEATRTDGERQWRVSLPVHGELRESASRFQSAQHGSDVGSKCRDVSIKGIFESSGGNPVQR
ncbi:hypothetical protein ACJRO7_016749 [Eucalyptus globulus]|uniref:Uncharacterized protein n=1 Tax=Eucalyptus globulus TaxID=34317 RepID=A0ABD3KMT3_EUCGL